jgi:hypothetical protein
VHIRARVIILGETVKVFEKFPFVNSITQIQTNENIAIW